VDKPMFVLVRKHFLDGQPLVRRLRFLCLIREGKTMLKTFAAVLILASVASLGTAQAMGHKHMMMKSCAEGQQATMKCTCGEAMKGHAMVCDKGQWCHSFMHSCGK
jgi:hypothetical protein